MPLGFDELAAYFNAGIGVAALELGVPVKRLSLKVNNSTREKPRLMSLNNFFKSNPDIGCEALATRYATVLLAGPAGRVIGLERYLDYSHPNLELHRLRTAFYLEARSCQEPVADTALAIIVAWLRKHNGGDADATFKQLWFRADVMLRSEALRPRLDFLAAELRKRRVMTMADICHALKS